MINMFQKVFLDIDDPSHFSSSVLSSKFEEVSKAELIKYIFRK